jgi:hypothetical protein
MWGYINKGSTPRERAEYFLKDMEDHNINLLMYSISKDVREFMVSPEGVAYSQRTGMRMMANWPGNARKLRAICRTPSPISCLSRSMSRALRMDTAFLAMAVLLSPVKRGQYARVSSAASTRFGNY